MNIPTHLSPFNFESSRDDQPSLITLTRPFSEIRREPPKMCAPARSVVLFWSFEFWCGRRTSSLSAMVSYHRRCQIQMGVLNVNAEVDGRFVDDEEDGLTRPHQTRPKLEEKEEINCKELNEQTHTNERTNERHMHLIDAPTSDPRRPSQQRNVGYHHNTRYDNLVTSVL